MKSRIKVSNAVAIVLAAIIGFTAAVLAPPLHATGLKPANGSSGGGSGTVTSVTATAPFSITSTPTTTPNVTSSMATASFLGRTTAGTGAVETLSAGQAWGVLGSSGLVYTPGGNLAMNTTDLFYNATNKYMGLGTVTTDLAGGTGTGITMLAAGSGVPSIEMNSVTARTSGNAAAFFVYNAGQPVVEIDYQLDGASNSGKYIFYVLNGGSYVDALEIDHTGTIKFGSPSTVSNGTQVLTVGATGPAGIASTAPYKYMTAKDSTGVQIWWPVYH